MKSLFILYNLYILFNILYNSPYIFKIKSKSFSTEKIPFYAQSKCNMIYLLKLGFNYFLNK